MSIRHANIGKGTQTITGTVSGGGGGVQYVVATTGVSTGTGTLFIGVNVDTAVPIKVDAAGVVSVSGGGGGVQYTINTTDIAATGTGTLFIGIQSGATTARGWMFTTSGAGHVFMDNAVTITTGSVDIVNTPTMTIGNSPTVTVATGTVNVVVLPAVSGSVSVINTPTFTIGNTPTVTVTPNPLPILFTHNATQWNSGLVTITTSAAGMSGILKVSAANTPYVTDVFISVDVPMNIALRSATTNMALLYFATKGGMAYQFRTPMVCTTAQSFTFIPSLSGSASVWAAGYTVT